MGWCVAILIAAVSFRVSAQEVSEPLSVDVSIKLNTDEPSFRRAIGDIKQLVTMKFEDELTRNIASSLTLEQQKSSLLLTDKRVNQLIVRGQNEIAVAMQPFGFYKPEISHTASKKGAVWQVEYHVTPGPVTRVKKLDILLTGEGQQEPELLKHVKKFPLRLDEVLLHRRYEDGKRDLLRRALAQGYLDARITEHRVEVSREQETATVRVVLETGPRFRFGPIHFAPTVLEEDYLQRHVPFKRGDAYSTDLLVEMQNNLYNSDYFSNVEIDSRRDLVVQGEIPLDIRLVPREKHRYAAGIGYSSDIGPRQSLSWTNRRLNTRGDSLKTDLRISPVRDNFNARYAIPLRSARTDEINLSFAWIDESLPDKEDEMFLYGISRTMGRRNNWLETVYLNYQVDSYHIEDTQDETEFLIPGVIYSHSDADNFTNTWHGHRVSIDVRAANTAVISDGSFTQTILNAKWITRVYGPTRLILRGEAGATFFGDTQKLPPSLRFFAGGDQSVRGFSYEALSPDDLGGEQLLVGSAEFEWRFLPRWGLAVFTDAGNAMNSWTTPLERSAGIGVRWVSPIGPVRLDRAWQLTDFEGDEQAWILVIGPEL